MKPWMFLALFSSLLWKVHAAEIDWPTVKLIPLVSGLATPTTIAHARDGSGRLFITEKVGRIRIAQGTNLLAESFLDITSRVRQGEPSPETGLLGLAFPPDFATQACFYIYYNRQPDLASVLSRFRVTATNQNVADPASEQVLLVVPQSSDRHKAGCLAFGVDGYLYVSLGDDNAAVSSTTHPSQDPQSLLGKILRLDVSGQTNGYSIPPSNPFRTNNAYRPEIWALGFRNPWRLSFDRLTGDVYFTDAGTQGGEEINFQPAGSAGGENYGWNLLLANNCIRSLAGAPHFFTVEPVRTWAVPGIFVAQAVIGGHVYRGTNFPRLQGFYIFSDYGLSRMWAMKFDGTQWKTATLIDTNWGTPSTFGEDEQGELYVADIIGGIIYQVVDANTPHRPVFAWTNTVHASSVPVNCFSPNARIHYTTENRDPTEADAWINPGGSIPVTPPQTIRASAFATNLMPSVVAQMIYTNFQVATPVLHPLPTAQGNFFEMSTATPVGRIHYTTNGTTPDTNSFMYTNPVISSSAVLFSVRAFHADSDPSLVTQGWMLPPPTVTFVNGVTQISAKVDLLSGPYYLYFSKDLRRWLLFQLSQFPQNGTVTFTSSVMFTKNQHDYQFFRIVRSENIPRNWP